MTKVAQLPRPDYAGADRSRILPADIETHGDEPRILDLTLAERLGFALPREIRQLIQRNEAELRTYGTLWHRATKSTGGRPGRECRLNEGQALLICALSRTTVAARVRRELITAFMEMRRQKAGAAPALPVPSAARTLTEADARKLRDAVGYFEHLAGYMRGVLGELAIPPAPRPDVPALPPSQRIAAPEPGEVLYGLRAIGSIYGIGEKAAKMRHQNGDLPTFRMGRTVCASRSSIAADIAAREATALAAREVR